MSESEDVALSPELIKQNISKFDSASVCVIINSAFELGFEKQIIITCMQELVRRRENGEVFDYESQIKMDAQTPQQIPVRSLINEYIHARSKQIR